MARTGADGSFRLASRGVPPFKTKMTEPILAVGLGVGERLAILRKAKYNLFSVRSADVALDFLTDSGTGAMSQEQWAAMMVGDEAYAGATSFTRFAGAFRRITGLRYVLPAHQGRAAERSLFEGLKASGRISEDSIIASNAFFDTTLGWASSFCRCENLYCGDFEAGNTVERPFKGDLELSRLKRLASENPGKVGLVLLTITNNTGGGQPASMANIRELSGFCRKEGILFFFDACRFAENAYFIHEREPGYARKTIKEIVWEMFSYVDGATFSAKKDARTNIGGAILFSAGHEKLYLACRPSIIRNEGLFTYGGMAGRDLEAVARGIEETTELQYLRSRVGQVATLHGLLAGMGVPLVSPAGGHAVYIDAKEYLARVPESEYRSDTLALLLYAMGGIRSVAIGNMMYAKKDAKGRILEPAKNDFVRLAIPRNVYSLDHMLYAAAVFGKVGRAKEALRRGVRVGPGFRNDHFDHFDCAMELADKKDFERAAQSA